MHHLTLAELKPGSKAYIVSVGGDGALRRRLLDLGLTPKTTILVHKIAPLGDPMELFLRGYTLTLRKRDAAKIEVESVSENTEQPQGSPGCSQNDGAAR